MCEQATAAAAAGGSLGPIRNPNFIGEADREPSIPDILRGRAQEKRREADLIDALADALPSRMDHKATTAALRLIYGGLTL